MKPKSYHFQGSLFTRFTINQTNALTISKKIKSISEEIEGEGVGFSEP